eukprot:TRINITY_DN7543_c0_g1_i1.p1 TRINITY_DN7543_c0_g1~~TRINITY_DN7543_c0_g1_i1.p1  ORF type:complete len:691 (-),score=148.56 TRINITY_DN7543_c0_g1_i1:37-2109(-)
MISSIYKWFYPPTMDIVGSLPEELLVRVLSALPVNSVVQLLGTSKTTRTLIDRPFIWRMLCVECPLPVSMLIFSQHPSSPLQYPFQDLFQDSYVFYDDPPPSPALTWRDLYLLKKDYPSIYKALRAADILRTPKSKEKDNNNNAENNGGNNAGENGGDDDDDSDNEDHIDINQHDVGNNANVHDGDEDDDNEDNENINNDANNTTVDAGSSKDKDEDTSPPSGPGSGFVPDSWPSCCSPQDKEEDADMANPALLMTLILVRPGVHREQIVITHDGTIIQGMGRRENIVVQSFTPVMSVLDAVCSQRTGKQPNVGCLVSGITMEMVEGDDITDMACVRLRCPSRLERCSVRAPLGNCVHVGPGDLDASVHQCDISGSIGMHIFSGMGNVQITDNIFHHLTSYGLIISSQASPLVRGNTFRKCEDYTLFLKPASSATIEHNTIEHCTKWAMFMTEAKPDTIVRHNKMSNCKGGIYMHSSFAEVTHNTIWDMETAINIQVGSAPHVAFNKLHNCLFGCMIDTKSRGHFEYNEVRHCTGNGFTVRNKSNPRIACNDIHHCRASGVSLLLASTATLSGNIIHDNEGGSIAQGRDCKVRSTNNVLERNEVESTKIRECLDQQICTQHATPPGIYTPQWWISCLTCCNDENSGVCLTCARECHQGHLLSQPVFCRFSCDCGSCTDGFKEPCRKKSKK